MMSLPTNHLSYTNRTNLPIVRCIVLGYVL